MWQDLCGSSWGSGEVTTLIAGDIPILLLATFPFMQRMSIRASVSGLRCGLIVTQSVEPDVSTSIRKWPLGFVKQDFWESWEGKGTTVAWGLPDPWCGTCRGGGTISGLPLTNPVSHRVKDACCHPVPLGRDGDAQAPTCSSCLRHGGTVWVASPESLSYTYLGENPPQISALLAS